MFKTALIATGLAGLVFAAQPAFAHSATSAEADVQVQHRMVKYTDLDLATAAGQSAFDSRLRRAASAVCEANYGPHPLAETMEARRCYRNAIQSAQRAMADRGMRFSTVKVAAR
ncbi:UrcA family protein [Novosphingobium sp.]|uniref:UrcA family protein n=1 Tax=Novosphingobium sp. TaxID=1874826 RepID=UPI003BAD97E5